MRRFVFFLGIAGLLPLSSAFAGQYGTDTQTQSPAIAQRAPSVIGPAVSQFAPPQQNNTAPQRAVDVEMGMSCGNLLQASSQGESASDIADLLDAILSAYDISDRNGVSIPAVHKKLTAYFLYFCKNRPNNSTDDAAAYAKDAVDQILIKAMK